MVGEYFCRSRIVVCIPRVLRVRALRLWCVYLGFVGGIVVEGGLLGSALVGLVEVCEEWEADVSGDVDSGGFGSASVGWGIGCGIVGCGAEGMCDWG